MSIVYLVLDPNADPNPTLGRNNERTFNTVARTLAPQNSAEIVMFANGAQAIQGMSRFDRIDRLVIFAHGAPSWIGWGSRRHGGGGIHSTRRAGGWKMASRFASAVGPKLVNGCIVGLAACTCGMPPSEWRIATEIDKESKGVSRRIQAAGGRSSAPIELRRRLNQLNTDLIGAQFGTNGVGSFAYILRNELVNAGAVGIEVRAHTWKGHTTHNPLMISFSGNLNSPGVQVSYAEYGRELTGREMLQWKSRRGEWHGERAQEWIIGGPSPEGAVAMANALGGTSVASVDPIPRQSTPSVIPNRHTGSMENSEASVRETPQNTTNQIITGSATLDRKEILMQRVRDWADTMEEDLDREIG
jgi:hypothetical protein